jgi:hypothetical protein
MPTGLLNPMRILAGGSSTFYYNERKFLKLFQGRLTMDSSVILCLSFQMTNFRCEHAFQLELAGSQNK